MRTRFTMALALSVLLVAWGCSRDNVSRANYDRIQNGMTQTQVIDILGAPDDRQAAGIAVGDMQAGMQNWVWRSGDRHITVTFVNDVVQAKTHQGL